MPSSVAELSTQAQALITQLNAHTTRLSNTLTQLTDDILRSGSRLAYEVELLRGETLSLTETMNESLQGDIRKFVPEGQALVRPEEARRDEARKGGSRSEGEDGGEGGGNDGKPKAAAETLTGDYPDYIQELEKLTLVRARLDSVIKTFGDAMDFVFPPSELSIGSSFLSVSAPEPGSEQQSSEEKGQQVLEGLREEIALLLQSRPEDPVEGIARAAQRVEELKELSRVWRGTAEEKGRSKFIDGLAKMVEDRHRQLMKEVEQAAKKEEATRPRKSSITRPSSVLEEAPGLPGGFGLLSQLQKLRSGL
jgi:hypothetical protein